MLKHQRFSNAIYHKKYIFINFVWNLCLKTPGIRFEAYQKIISKNMNNHTIEKQAWIFPGILYICLAVLDIVAISAGLADLHFVVKPMLMPVLAATALILFKSKSAPSAIIGFLMAALACHTAGDIFLLYDGNRIFIYGLLAFLVGHIFYIAIFGSNIRENTMKENPISALRITIYLTCCILLPVLVGTCLSKLSTALSIYVGIYAWILLSMTYLAGRCAALKLEGGKFAFIGTILFVLSDSLLGLNQFLDISFPFRHELIMLTYTMAQGFIVYGIGKFYNERRNLN